jgi:hypothetical protein
MDTIYYIIFVVLCVFVIEFIILTFKLFRQIRSKKDGCLIVSPTCFSFVNELALQTINTCIKLYGQKDDIEEFVQFVLREIKIKISNSELTDIEKDYWNHQRIEQSFLSLIVKTYRKAL